MVEFNTEGKQEFDADIFPVLLKDNKEKIFLSKEMSVLYGLIGRDAEKVLDGVLGYNSSNFEKIDFIPDGAKNSEYSFVSNNVSSFIIENNKIILNKLKK